MEAPPLAAGLVGAGPWAAMLHAPLLAAGPETRLAAVWARRPEAARELAARHGAVAVERYEDLLERCEVVAYSVPPAVQADLAPAAARAGRALLLEKPLAADLAGAEAVAAAVADAGVASVLVLSWRFSAEVRRLLAAVASAGGVAGHASFVSGALLGGPFATPWRLERGALLDLGPHVVDVLDAALGPVVAVEARGQRDGAVTLLLEHEGGAISTTTVCASLALPGASARVEVITRDAVLALDPVAATGPASFAVLRAELAAAARGGPPHPLDARRGLHLQRVLADAEAQLAARSRR